MAIVEVDDGTRAAVAAGAQRVASGSKYLDAHVMIHGPLVGFTYVVADLAASKAINLIDLSDTVNFKHTETGKIKLYTLDIVCEMKVMTAGAGILHVGVIVEVDATNGTAEWLAVMPIQTYLEPTDDTDRRVYHFEWLHGLDLEVAGATDTLANHLTNSNLAGNTLFQTDSALDGPAGAAASACGDGDLVMYWNETTDAITISISVTGTYVTEGT